MIEKINVYDSDLDTDHLKKIILKNESKIIEKYLPTTWDNSELFDGATGLGFKSLTSRSCHYNLLEWRGTKKLREAIKKYYQKYTSDTDEIYVQCWANVMRYGEQIKAHVHSDEASTKIYKKVSGNLFVCGDNTNTYYLNNPVENKSGRLVLFRSSIPHHTDAYLGDSERISIGFDIRTKFAWNTDILDEYKHHWIKL